MLWKPVTPGEEVYLKLYEAFGRYIDVRAEGPAALDMMASETGFVAFTRMTATTEIFLRLLRTALVQLPISGTEIGPDFGRRVMRTEDLPDSLASDRKLAALIKGAAEIARDADRGSAGLQKRVREASNNCYLCGIAFNAAIPRQHSTVEHLWPLSLGGSSIEENLIAACSDCNTKRADDLTWASGPVQQVLFKPGPDNLRSRIRISLALAKMAAHAKSRSGHLPKLLTLKQAAIAGYVLFPALQKLNDQHHTYFELMVHEGLAA